VDRKEACLAQAAACRAKAQADPANRGRWIDAAIDWLERAVQFPGRVEIMFEGNHHRPIGMTIEGDDEPPIANDPK
jgi:hypothetical protein